VPQPSGRTADGSRSQMALQVPYEIAYDLYLLDIVVRNFHARELILNR
jgi:hypothetical protein